MNGLKILSGDKQGTNRGQMDRPGTNGDKFIWPSNLLSERIGDKFFHLSPFSSIIKGVEKNNVLG